MTLIFLFCCFSIRSLIVDGVGIIKGASIVVKVMLRHIRCSKSQKDVVKFSSYLSLTDHSGELQIVQAGAIDCLTVRRIYYTNLAFLYHHGSIERNKGMWQNTEISIEIYGRIKVLSYLYFTYIPVFPVTSRFEECERTREP